MAGYAVNREQLVSVLRSALEPLEYVQAMWEAGAAAFGRVDEWSDIDLQVVADDNRTEDVFTAVEAALDKLSPVDIRYRMPEPAWHGHSQAFYRLENASPFLMLDFVVMKAGAKNKFLQAEIHSRPVAHFDKTGVIRDEPFDVEEFGKMLRGRVRELRTLFGLFRVLVMKELNRGNDIEAVAFYNSYTLRPLVQALRILHDPTRYNFHTRYVHYDLPGEAVQRLRELSYVRDADDLRVKHDIAESWMEEILGEIGEGPFNEDIELAAARTAGEEGDA